MSERTTVQEVFAEVEPDPDAVLESEGVDSPASLIAGGGRHDPDGDDANSDERVADLLENLKDAAIETTEATGTAADDRGRNRTDRQRTTTLSSDHNREPDRDRGTSATAVSDSSTAAEPLPEGLWAGAEVTIGEPNVTVLPEDGAVIDSMLGIEPTRDHPTPDLDRQTSDLDLIGSPTVTRLSSDAFGGS